MARTNAVEWQDQAAREARPDHQLQRYDGTSRFSGGDSGEEVLPITESGTETSIPPSAPERRIRDRLSHSCSGCRGWRLPPRNRIIAGLSAAVVVVEAAKTGGALITAVKAAEYGIPVFAMPGDVDRRTSEGTNRLIRDGAFPVFDPDDLIEELSLIRDLASTRKECEPRELEVLDLRV